MGLQNRLVLLLRLVVMVGGLRFCGSSTAASYDFGIRRRCTGPQASSTISMSLRIDPYWPYTALVDPWYLLARLVLLAWTSHLTQVSHVSLVQRIPFQGRVRKERKCLRAEWVRNKAVGNITRQEVFILKL
jgi:hypothetical protein